MGFFWFFLTRLLGVWRLLKKFSVSGGAGTIKTQLTRSKYARRDSGELFFIFFLFFSLLIINFQRINICTDKTNGSLRGQPSGRCEKVVSPTHPRGRNYSFRTATILRAAYLRYLPPGTTGHRRKCANTPERFLNRLSLFYGTRRHNNCSIVTISTTQLCISGPECRT